MDGLIVQDFLIQMVECSACNSYDPIKLGMFFETTSVSNWSTAFTHQKTEVKMGSKSKKKKKSCVY